MFISAFSFWICWFSFWAFNTSCCELAWALFWTIWVWEVLVIDVVVWIFLIGVNKRLAWPDSCDIFWDWESLYFSITWGSSIEINKGLVSLGRLDDSCNDFKLLIKITFPSFKVIDFIEALSKDWNSLDDISFTRTFSVFSVFSTFSSFSTFSTFSAFSLSFCILK